MRALIPSLTIQPLLENAIYHGIELLPDGGEVSVTGKRDGKDLIISMSNPVASGTERSKRGNKMAMSNIRQRFELAYGNRAAVEISDENDRFTVSLRVLIVDDEKPARDRLRQLLEDFDEYEVVAEAGNGEEAISLAAETTPDIVLLDIRMPGLDGIEAAHHLNKLESPPAIVFATAYDEYAIDAFDARAIGYVLKPVRRERLAGALEHAARLAAGTLAEVAAASHMDSRRKHVCSTSHGQLKLIPVKDVYYFQADQKYVANTTS
jgi:DNA-binding NarL/FixJ family response regulator